MYKPVAKFCQSCCNINHLHLRVECYALVKQCYGIVLFISVMLPVKLHVQMDAMHILNSSLAKLNYLGAKSSWNNLQMINPMSNCKIEGKVTLKSMMAIVFHVRQTLIKVCSRSFLQYW